MSDPKEYTIGWISALSIEHTAARLFLDREHDPPEPDLIAATDNNAYTLGEINGHKIVIAVLPHGEYGTSTATSVATNMLHSFPNIRVALMVGIGGGAPTAENDIRLGDVVVSIPRDGRGGVYQYDYGKRIQDHGFQATGHLNQPPLVVLTATNKLKSNYDIDGHKIDEAINAILERKPRLKKHYSRPPRHADVLYASHIVHPVDGASFTCKELCMEQSSEIINQHKRAVSDVDSPDRRGKKRCSTTIHESDLDLPTAVPNEDGKHQRVDEDREEARLSLSRTIDRPERGIEEHDPAIHYGSIASGNSLMKDAMMRDELAAKEGILCFEMEAAGIMNNLPCLVVRGICDYSDSHKNKQWQGYAALTAAAYTKDLLKVMVPQRVVSEKRLAPMFESLFSKATSIQNILEASQEKQQADDIKKWLSPSDPSVSLQNSLGQRHQGTCQWLLDSDYFHDWLKAQGSFFWLHGLSGCGKTVLASSVIEHLRSQTPQPLFAYFYFDVNGGGRRDLSQMLRSVLCQLCLGKPAKEVLLALYCDCGLGARQPTDKQLSDTLISVLAQVNEATLVIDALDECSTPEDLALWLKDPSLVTHNSHLLVTSRNHGTMNSAIHNWPRQDQIHAIQIDDVNRDIACYVHERLFKSAEFLKWSSHRGLREHVEDTVLKQANGMFRLAACQLDDLKPCIDRSRLLEGLQTLPRTLQEIYSRILDKLRDGHCFREALFMLQYVLWSESPPSFLELVDAIAVRLDESPVFRRENRLFDLKDVIIQCSSLLIVVNKTNDLDEHLRQEIHLAHSSVKEYLTSQYLVRPFDVLLSEVQARATIAKTSIMYIIDVANVQYRALENPDEPWEHLNISDFPFVQRAVLWTEHAKVIEKIDSEIVHLIIKLYKQRRLLQRFPQIIGLSLSHKFGSYEYIPVPITDIVEGPNPFIHACYWGLETVVRYMLNRRVDPDSCGYIDSPLHAASYNGHCSIVEMLLQRAADVNGHSRRLGSTAPVPLVGASRNGHHETVQILLRYGASASLHDFDHRTAIEIATSRGHVSIVQLLAASNAYYPLRPDVYELAIVEATNSRQFEIVRLLAQHITLTSNRIRTKKLFSVLTDAFDRDCYETTSLLLLTGAYKNCCLNPVAVSAIEKRHIKMLKLLLEHRANPLGCDHSPEDSPVPHFEGPSPFEVALSQRPVDEQIISLLFEKTSLLLLKGAYKNTCLNSAAVLVIKKRFPKILELFLEHGANPLGCNHSPGNSLIPHSKVSSLLEVALNQRPVDDQTTSLLFEKLTSLDKPLPIRETNWALVHFMAKDELFYVEALLTKFVDWHIDLFDLQSEPLQLLDKKHPGLAKVLLDQALERFPGICGEVTLWTLYHHMKTMTRIRRQPPLREAVVHSKVWDEDLASSAYQYSQVLQTPGTNLAQESFEVHFW